MYPIFLALRYARARVVTYLALLTVAVSVASFVVVMGVLSGFRHRVEQIIQETGAPLEVASPASQGIEDPAELTRRLEAVPGVSGTSPYRNVFALIRTPHYSSLGVVRGIDLARELRWGRLGSYLQGDLPVRTDPEVDRLAPELPPLRRAESEAPRDFSIPEDLAPAEEEREPENQGTVPVHPEPEKPRPPSGAIVGTARARQLGLYRGSTFVLTTEGPDKALRSHRFVVIGFYDSRTEWLNNIILVDLRDAAYLTGLNSPTGVSVWLKDSREMLAVRQRIERVVPASEYVEVRTWRESRAEIFETLDMQDRVMLIVLLIFFGMTGAFIMAILWVLVAEKTRDIGTVRALGAGRLGVVATFAAQGMGIALCGEALGLGMGYLLAQNVNPVVNYLDSLLVKVGCGEVFGSISRSLFEMNDLPVHYEQTHLVAMAIVTAAVSLVASIAPALRAAWLDPVEALRRE